MFFIDQADRPKENFGHTIVAKLETFEKNKKNITQSNDDFCLWYGEKHHGKMSKCWCPAWMAQL